MGTSSEVGRPNFRQRNLRIVKKGIDKRLSLANISGIYKANREFGNALGAIAYAKENN